MNQRAAPSDPVLLDWLPFKPELALKSPATGNSTFLFTHFFVKSQLALKSLPVYFIFSEKPQTTFRFFL